MRELLKEYGTTILAYMGGIFAITIAYLLFRGGLAAGILMRFIEEATWEKL